MLNTTDLRVILHVDMDCFYVQVEQRRLQIPRDTPCAVQQWEGLIAVNYAARAKGITRHMRIGEALTKCPELQLIHVQTISENLDEDGDDDLNTGTTTTAAGAEPSGEAMKNKRLTHKACLERYRKSSAEIRALVHKLVPNAPLEKVGTDEFFLDVTKTIDSKFEQGGDSTAPPSADGFAWGSIVSGGPLDPGSLVERRLAEGAAIACRLRGALLSELGFTSSAGISFNKLLAKIGSGLHKPNQQTVIPPRAVAALMQTLPLGKIWGMGGKLGQQLESMGCSTAGDVLQMNQQELEKRLGVESGRWVMQVVQGQHSEEVKPREKPKSMLAAKSFNATSDASELKRWMRVLATELAMRITTDELEYKRKPRTLTIQYRGGSNTMTERSRSCPMPHISAQQRNDPAAIVKCVYEAAWNVWSTGCMSDGLPCTRLAIFAGNFVDLHVGSNASIGKFFKPKSETAEYKADGGGGGNGDEGHESAGLDVEEPVVEEEQQQMQQQQEEEPEQHTTANDTTNNDNATTSKEDMETEAALAGIDLQEQKRIMKELEMLNKLGSHKPASTNNTNNNNAPTASGNTAKRQKTSSGNDKPSKSSKSILSFLQPKK